jgi:hypothetical protein
VRAVIYDWCGSVTQQLTNLGYAHNQVIEDVVLSDIMLTVEQLIVADLDVMISRTDQSYIIYVDQQGRKFRQR